MQKWGILKATHIGPHLNSPSVWVHFGTIDDDSPESAIMRACFLVGSPEVKIVPICEYGEIHDG